MKLFEQLRESIQQGIARAGFRPRPLTAQEIREARKVFGEQVDYQKVLIFEGNEVPNRIDDIGRWLKRMPKRDRLVKNAITFGNWCLFGRLIQTQRAHDMGWLVHELTHVWQFQHMGWRYLLEALQSHRKSGAKAYDFGGESGLEQHRRIGTRFTDFNLEQQGDIAKHYYRRLAEGKDPGIWGFYIRQLREGS